MKGLVEREKVKMKPEEWRDCLLKETTKEFAKAGGSVSKLPESAKKVLQLNFQIFNSHIRLLSCLKLE